MKRIVQGLGFQISVAFLVLILLFVGASLRALGAFQVQISYNGLLDMAARLAITGEQMHIQAMNYKQNAPRDYPTYYRDVKLYYQDLIGDMAIFDDVVERFMEGDYRMSIGGVLPFTRPRVGPEVSAAVADLEEVWAGYRKGLLDALGDDSREPRLEWAAEFVLANDGKLREASNALGDALRAWSNTEHQRLIRGAFLLVAVATVTPLLLLLLLAHLALRPLRRTIGGFQRVAEGDFGHRTPVEGTTEVRELAESFNRLSSRLNLLHRLLERLQRGNDLDELAGFLSQEFRELLGFDWLGVISIDETRSTALLETARLDGARPTGAHPVFPFDEQLLATALSDEGPHQVPEISDASSGLAGHLFGLGMRSAMLLPLRAGAASMMPAVVCFASRNPQRYDPEGGRILGNIAQLLALSFSRTARLAEQTRLAAVGELASAIAHELRSPLATISLTLEHFDGLAIAERSRRRLELSERSCRQMERLLEDLLLYARPLRLDLDSFDLGVLLADHVREQQELYPQFALALKTSCDHAWICADQLRIRQILDNLTKNAREAASPGSVIRLTLSAEDSSGVYRVAVRNRGQVIPPEVIARLPRPFYTTKQDGTGLGLAIAQRLSQRHGGRLTIRSEPGLDTEVAFTLPASDDSRKREPVRRRIPVAEA